MNRWLLSTESGLRLPHSWGQQHGTHVSCSIVTSGPLRDWRLPSRPVIQCCEDFTSHGASCMAHMGCAVSSPLVPCVTAGCIPGEASG